MPCSVVFYIIRPFTFLPSPAFEEMVKKSFIIIGKQQLPYMRLPINPLHPKIRMHILYTLLYVFPKLLTGRIYLSIKVFLGWWPFPLFSWPECLTQWWYFKEKLDASHSYELKGPKNQLHFSFIIPVSTTPYLPLHPQLSQKGKGDENLFSVCDNKKTHKTLKKWLTSHLPFLPFISVCISLGICLPCCIRLGKTYLLVIINPITGFHQ